MNMLSFVPEYEKITGDKLSADVLNFIKDLDTYGKKFEKKGMEDSAHGLPVPTDEAFSRFGHKVFDGDPDMADKMSYLNIEVSVISRFFQAESLILVILSEQLDAEREILRF